MVAIFTNNPISEAKKKKIASVPEASKSNQPKYPFDDTLSKRSSVVLCIALGEASKVVSVVLNIVVNAAIPMMI